MTDSTARRLERQMITALHRSSPECELNDLKMSPSMAVSTATVRKGSRGQKKRLGVVLEGVMALRIVGAEGPNSVLQCGRIFVGRRRSGPADDAAHRSVKALRRGGNP